MDGRTSLRIRGLVSTIIFWTIGLRVVVISASCGVDNPTVEKNRTMIRLVLAIAIPGTYILRTSSHNYASHISQSRTGLNAACI